MTNMCGNYHKLHLCKWSIKLVKILPITECKKLIMSKVHVPKNHLDPLFLPIGGKISALTVWLWGIKFLFHCWKSDLMPHTESALILPSMFFLSGKTVYLCHVRTLAHDSTSQSKTQHSHWQGQLTETGSKSIQGQLHYIHDPMKPRRLFTKGQLVLNNTITNCI